MRRPFPAGVLGSGRRRNQRVHRLLFQRAGSTTSLRASRRSLDREQSRVRNDRLARTSIEVAVLPTHYARPRYQSFDCRLLSWEMAEQRQLHEVLHAPHAQLDDCRERDNLGHYLRLSSDVRSTVSGLHAGCRKFRRHPFRLQLHVDLSVPSDGVGTRSYVLDQSVLSGSGHSRPETGLSPVLIHLRELSGRCILHHRDAGGSPCCQARDPFARARVVGLPRLRRALGSQQWTNQSQSMRAVRSGRGWPCRPASRHPARRSAATNLGCSIAKTWIDLEQHYLFASEPISRRPQRDSMRILALLVIVAGSSLAAEPIQAQTYDPAFPFCMRVTPWGGGTYEDCTYYSMEQCQMSASGRAAQCNPNPYYARPIGPAIRKHRYRHNYWDTQLGNLAKPHRPCGFRLSGNAYSCWF